jgi:hypothetical protein
MSTAKPQAPKPSRSIAKGSRMYHGVRIPETGARSRFSREELDRAIAAAIAKNPDVFARKD